MTKREKYVRALFRGYSYLNVTAASFDVTGLLIDMWQVSHVKCDSCHFDFVKPRDYVKPKILGVGQNSAARAKAYMHTG